MRKPSAKKSLKAFEDAREHSTCEVSRLVPRVTSLSRSLWLDDFDEDKNVPHSTYRIRVQARMGDSFNSRTNAVCIYFDKDEPYIDTKNPAKHDISGQEFKEIKNFIKKHVDLLKKFYTHKNEYDTLWLILEIDKRKSSANDDNKHHLIVDGKKHVYSTDASKTSAKYYWRQKGAKVFDPDEN